MVLSSDSYTRYQTMSSGQLGHQKPARVTCFGMRSERQGATACWYASCCDMACWRRHGSAWALCTVPSLVACTGVCLMWRSGMPHAGACWRRHGGVRWRPRTGTRWPRTGRAAAMLISAAGSERRWWRARPLDASAPSQSTACRWSPGALIAMSCHVLTEKSGQ